MKENPDEVMKYVASASTIISQWWAAAPNAFIFEFAKGMMYKAKYESIQGSVQAGVAREKGTLMSDKKLIGNDVHQANEAPEDRAEVYVFTKDKKMICCEYRSGEFWIDQYATLEKQEILFWSESIVFDE